MKKSSFIVIYIVCVLTLAAMLLAAVTGNGAAAWTAFGLCAVMAAVLPLAWLDISRRFRKLREDERFIRLDMGLQRLLRGESTPSHVKFSRQWISGNGDVSSETVFPEDGFCVIGFTIDDYDEARLTGLYDTGVIKHADMNAEDIACILIRAAAGEEFKAAGIVCESVTMEWDIYCVANFVYSEKDNVETLYKISRCCSNVLERMEKEHGAVISCFISSAGRGVENVSDLYDEVLQIENYKKMLSLRDRKLMFTEMSIDGPNSRLPELAGDKMPDSGRVLEQYRVFVNCMAAHDYAAANSVIQSIINEEFGETTPAVEFAPYRLHSLINMLINTFDYIKEDIGSQVYSSIFPSCGLTEVRTAEELSRTVDHIFQVIINSRGEPVHTVPEWVGKMKRYVEENYTDPDLNLNLVAMHFGLNPAYTSRSFKLYTGTGLLDYIHSLRIAEAKRLLASGMTVKETAEKAGFSNTRSMNRSFLKYEGVAPKKMSKSDIL